MLSLIIVLYASSACFIASSANNITIALLQILPGNDTEENIFIADRYCRQAVELGADIAIIPEMWNIGYSTLFSSYNASNEQPVRDWLE